MGLMSGLLGGMASSCASQFLISVLRSFEFWLGSPSCINKFSSGLQLKENIVLKFLRTESAKY